MQKRHNNYKIYQQALTSEQEYKLFRKFINNQFRMTTKKYYEKLIHENKSLRKTYNVQNKVLCKTRQRSRLEIKSINKINRKKNTDSYEICQRFKDFSFSRNSKIQKNVPSLLSGDEFAYHLRDVHLDAPLKVFIDTIY